MADVSDEMLEVIFKEVSVELVELTLPARMRGRGSP